MKLFKANENCPECTKYILVTSDGRVFDLSYHSKSKHVNIKPLGATKKTHPGYTGYQLISSIPNVLKTHVFRLQKKPSLLN